MSFQINPLNLDLITIKNETAISRSVRNLVLTQKGERFFNFNLGSDLYKTLFDNLDEFSALAIKDQIKYLLKVYEPRIEIIDVAVEPNYDGNEFNVVIKYKIIGIDVPAQKLSFALQPTR